MPEKQRGTADVTLTAWLLGDENGAGAYRVLQRFAQGARLRGTVVLVGQPVWEWMPDPDTPELEPPVLRLTLRYRHTCKNRGNHDSDAQRFFERALAVGTDREWAGDVIDVTLNSWKPEA
jgi:hypothetical protein